MLDNQPGQARRVLLPLAGPLLIFVLWLLLHRLAFLSNSLLPDPIVSISRLIHMVVSGSVLIDVLDSLGRMFLGFCLAAVAGVCGGLIIGRVRFLYEATEGTIDFFRSVPVTTLYPVFVLMFGIGHLSKVAMVFWACVFVITLNTAYGVIQSNKTRFLMSKLYGASTLQLLRWVVLYDALPQTLIGLRIGLSFALIVEILCEMFMGSRHGIGQRIIEAFTTYSTVDLYALIILSGLIGLGLNRLFVFMEKRLVPWVYT